MKAFITYISAVAPSPNTFTTTISITIIITSSRSVVEECRVRAL